MRTLRSAVSAVPLSLALVLGSATVDAQTPTAGSRPRLQGDAWRAAGTAGICGKGSYEFKLAGAKAGNESFETTCVGSGAAGGGYASAAHTIFSVPGAAIDLVTTLEVGADWVPTRFTARGQAGPNEIEQSLQLGGDTATVVAKGQTRRLPYSRGAAFLSQNIYHLLPFVVARYDLAAGGVQQVPIFPRASVSLELQGADTVRPERVTVGPSGPATRFVRYHLGAGLGSATIWFDEAGRMAVVTAPAQQFVGVRSDFTEFAKPLMATIAREVGAAVASTLETTDYSAPAGAPFTAADVTIPVASYQLAGTLLLPKRGATAASAKLPAVVMITGSGQQARDERLPIPGLERYRPFRQIAETLAARGIAVLRVDDRGAGASTGQQTYN
ncbi:MAG TPA: hypothetical protein VKA84_01280, partial [Gemmatimonadaceae bacterium]|nr:hypothetical protein [Gemmatimonadaceae bacterium]